MMEILEVIQQRSSSRGPFDPEHPISKHDLTQILEAARWAPTAHNMQNFEIIVVDDKEILKAMADLKSSTSATFIRENYQQLSFSEEELRRKKVGLLGTMFPPEMRNPGTGSINASNESASSFQSKLIRTSPVLLVMIYDPGRRAPASEGDFLGIVSLGCVLENMWLMAHSLGIGFQVLSAISAYPIKEKVKKLLDIPGNLQIAFSVRLGYTTGWSNYLRVRRDIDDFTNYNRLGHKGLK